MSNPQDIANKFMAAYGKDAQWVYGRIKDECLAVFGDKRSFSVTACNWMDKTADDMELWIIENVVPTLANDGYPKVHSKGMADAVWYAVHNECKKG